MFVPDVKADHRWLDPPRAQASGLRSVFAVPLIHQGTAIGVVGLDSPLFTAAHPPVDLDIARLEALASQAAIAVTTARLYDESERDRQRLRSLQRERQLLEQHVGHLRDEVRAAGAFGDILGESPAFTAVLEQALLVAPGDTTALLLGETGTGKELLARFIHERSARARGPFVAVNCAALPEALIESELFGHERGAFTGAIARKSGKFELAHRGSLFLDEIGDLPPAAQAKLLRVLQDGMVQRIGSTQAVAVDVRVIAATNQDLEAAIATAHFRTDLYYRLSVFPLRIPPLRERRDDIGLLARYFVGRSAARLRRCASGLTDHALERLRCVRLARQRARTAERDRTRGDPLARRDGRRIGHRDPHPRDGGDVEPRSLGDPHPGRCRTARHRRRARRHGLAHQRARGRRRAAGPQADHPARHDEATGHRAPAAVTDSRPHSHRDAI